MIRVVQAGEPLIFHRGLGAEGCVGTHISIAGLKRWVTAQAKTCERLPEGRVSSRQGDVVTK
jgi:hypothetical protein